MGNLIIRELDEEEKNFIRRQFPKSILSHFIDPLVLALYYECQCEYEDGSDPITSFEFGLLKMDDDNTVGLYRIPLYKAKKAQIAESCSRELRRAGILEFTQASFYKENLTIYGLRCENVSSRQTGGTHNTGFNRDLDVRKKLSLFLQDI